MKMRISSFVTAIVTAIVTASVSIETPASAEILTVCANSTQSSAPPERLPPTRFAGPIIPLSGQARIEEDALIALWHDGEGFDILVNWGERSQHSLRSNGAQVIGAVPSSDLVHLMVAHADGGVEHFLFNLDANGSGELLRSLAADLPGITATSSNAVCAKPH